MNINVLRLDHRIGRDTRITTHVCLTARAFGASKVWLAGEEDHSMMKSVSTPKTIESSGLSAPEKPISSTE